MNAIGQPKRFGQLLKRLAAWPIADNQKMSQRNLASHSSGCLQKQFMILFRPQRRNDSGNGCISRHLKLSPQFTGGAIGMKSLRVDTVWNDEDFLWRKPFVLHQVPAMGVGHADKAVRDVRQHSV